MCTSCYIHVDIEGLYHLLHTILFTLKFVFKLQNKYVCIVHFSKISVLGNRNIKSYIINFFLHLWIIVKNTCIILKKINSSYAKNIERQRTLWSFVCIQKKKNIVKWKKKLSIEGFRDLRVWDAHMRISLLYLLKYFKK